MSNISGGGPLPPGAAKMKADSTITMRGTFDDGGDLGVEIKDCQIA